MDVTSDSIESAKQLQHFSGGNGPTKEYPDPLPADAADVEKHFSRKQNTSIPKKRRNNPSVNMQNGVSSTSVFPIKEVEGMPDIATVDMCLSAVNVKAENSSEEPNESVTISNTNLASCSKDAPSRVSNVMVVGESEPSDTIQMKEENPPVFVTENLEDGCQRVNIKTEYSAISCSQENLKVEVSYPEVEHHNEKLPMKTEFPDITIHDTSASSLMYFPSVKEETQNDDFPLKLENHSSSNTDTSASVNPICERASIVEDELHPHHTNSAHGEVKVEKLTSQTLHADKNILQGRQSTCSVCGLNFNTDDQLTMHMKYAHGEVQMEVDKDPGETVPSKPRVCPISALCFSDEGALAVYKQNTHADGPDKLSYCKICELQFSGEDVLMIHMKYTHVSITEPKRRTDIATVDTSLAEENLKSDVSSEEPKLNIGTSNTNQTSCAKDAASCCSSVVDKSEPFDNMPVEEENPQVVVENLEVGCHIDDVKTEYPVICPEEDFICKVEVPLPENPSVVVMENVEDGCQKVNIKTECCATSCSEEHLSWKMEVPPPQVENSVEQLPGKTESQNIGEPGTSYSSSSSFPSLKKDLQDHNISLNLEHSCVKMKVQKDSDETNCGKSVICQICGLGFSAAGVLALHQKYSHGTKSKGKEKIDDMTTQYLCTVCNEVYPEMNNIMEHMRIHTGEKPFKCDVCGRHFPLRRTLKEHASVCGKKIYECTLCTLRYKRKINYEKHMKKKHQQLC